MPIGGVGGGGVGGGFDFTDPDLPIPGGQSSSSLGDLPSIPGFNEENIRGYAGLLSRLAERQFNLGAPIQERAFALLNDALSGGGDLLRQFASPQIAALMAQLPQAQRRLADQLPAGGALSEGITRLEEGTQGGISQIMSQLGTGLLERGLGVGTNLLGSLVSPLSAAGSLLVARKGAKGGGKK